MVPAEIASSGLGSSSRFFHCSSSSEVGLPLVAAEFRDQRDHAGIDQRVGFLSLVVPAQQPADATGQIGHVRAPLIEDQIRRARSRSQRFWSAATR